VLRARSRLTVPLISGHIDSVYFTSDATISGDWCHVEWVDWAKMKKLKSSEAALDTSISVRSTGTGARAASSSLFFPSCPSSIFAGLKTYQNGNAHHTYAGVHPQLGSFSYEIEVLSLVVPEPGNEGDQWQAGDPLAKVTVRVAIFGVTP
jgi:hypothetical protein